MKAYYTLAELISPAYPLRNLLHQLVHSDSDAAYVFVSEIDNKRLCKQGGFLRIPKKILQNMEISACDGGTFFSVEILHLCLTKKVEIWDQYLEDDELINHITEKDLGPYQEYKRTMPEYYKAYTPLERLKQDKKEKTKKLISASQTFVRSDSELVRNLMKSKATVVLAPYLDPNHIGHSVLLAAAVNTWVDIHIKGKGKKNLSLVKRAEELITTNYPTIAPTQRGRIASWINPTDNKKIKLKNNIDPS